jgi:DNA-binding transcriptional MerR regulator
MSSTQIAERLNSEGFHTPNGADRFSGAMVYTFLVRQGLFGQGTPRQWNRDTLRRNEWSLNKLARELGMPVATLRAWHRRGWISGRKSKGVNGAWNLWADKRELKRLRRLRAWKRGGYNLKRPAELITPSGSRSSERNNANRGSRRSGRKASSNKRRTRD